MLMVLENQTIFNRLDQCFSHLCELYNGMHVITYKLPKHFHCLGFKWSQIEKRTKTTFNGSLWDYYEQNKKRYPTTNANDPEFFSAFVTADQDNIKKFIDELNTFISSKDEDWLAVEDYYLPGFLHLLLAMRAAWFNYKAKVKAIPYTTINQLDSLAIVIMDRIQGDNLSYQLRNNYLLPTDLLFGSETISIQDIISFLISAQPSNRWIIDNSNNPKTPLEILTQSLAIRIENKGLQETQKAVRDFFNIMASEYFGGGLFNYWYLMVSSFLERKNSGVAKNSLAPIFPYMTLLSQGNDFLPTYNSKTRTMDYALLLNINEDTLKSFLINLLKDLDGLNVKNQQQILSNLAIQFIRQGADYITKWVNVLQDLYNDTHYKESSPYWLFPVWQVVCDNLNTESMNLVSSSNTSTSLSVSPQLEKDELKTVAIASWYSQVLSYIDSRPLKLICVDLGLTEENTNALHNWVELFQSVSLEQGQRILKALYDKIAVQIGTEETSSTNESSMRILSGLKTQMNAQRAAKTNIIFQIEDLELTTTDVLDKAILEELKTQGDMGLITLWNNIKRTENNVIKQHQSFISIVKEQQQQVTKLGEQINKLMNDLGLLIAQTEQKHKSDTISIAATGFVLDDKTLSETWVKTALTEETNPATQLASIPTNEGSSSVRLSSVSTSSASSSALNSSASSSSSSTLNRHSRPSFIAQSPVASASVSKLLSSGSMSSLNRIVEPQFSRGQTFYNNQRQQKYFSDKQAGQKDLSAWFDELHEAKTQIELEGQGFVNMLSSFPLVCGRITEVTHKGFAEDRMTIARELIENRKGFVVTAGTYGCLVTKTDSKYYQYVTDLTQSSSHDLGAGITDTFTITLDRGESTAKEKYVLSFRRYQEESLDHIEIVDTDADAAEDPVKKACLIIKERVNNNVNAIPSLLRIVNDLPLIEKAAAIFSQDSPSEDIQLLKENIQILKNWQINYLHETIALLKDRVEPLISASQMWTETTPIDIKLLEEFNRTIVFETKNLMDPLKQLLDIQNQQLLAQYKSLSQELFEFNRNVRPEDKKLPAIPQEPETLAQAQANIQDFQAQTASFAKNVAKYRRAVEQLNIQVELFKTNQEYFIVWRKVMARCSDEGILYNRFLQEVETKNRDHSTPQYTREVEKVRTAFYKQPLIVKYYEDIDYIEKLTYARESMADAKLFVDYQNDFNSITRQYDQQHRMLQDRKQKFIDVINHICTLPQEIENVGGHVRGTYNNLVNQFASLSNPAQSIFPTEQREPHAYREETALEVKLRLNRVDQVDEELFADVYPLNDRDGVEIFKQVRLSIDDEKLFNSLELLKLQLNEQRDALEQAKQTVAAKRQVLEQIRNRFSQLQQQWSLDIQRAVEVTHHENLNDDVMRNNTLSDLKEIEIRLSSRLHDTQQTSNLTLSEMETLFLQYQIEQQELGRLTQQQAEMQYAVNQAELILHERIEQIDERYNQLCQHKQAEDKKQKQIEKRKGEIESRCLNLRFVINDLDHSTGRIYALENLQLEYGELVSNLDNNILKVQKSILSEQKNIQDWLSYKTLTNMRTFINNRSSLPIQNPFSVEGISRRSFEQKLSDVSLALNKLSGLNAASPNSFDNEKLDGYVDVLKNAEEAIAPYYSYLQTLHQLEACQQIAQAAKNELELKSLEIENSSFSSRLRRFLRHPVDAILHPFNAIKELFWGKPAKAMPEVPNVVMPVGVADENTIIKVTTFNYIASFDGNNMQIRLPASVDFPTIAVQEQTDARPIEQSKERGFAEAFTMLTARSLAVQSNLTAELSSPRLSPSSNSPLSLSLGVLLSEMSGDVAPTAPQEIPAAVRASDESTTESSNQARSAVLNVPTPASRREENSSVDTLASTKTSGTFSLIEKGLGKSLSSTSLRSEITAQAQSSDEVSPEHADSGDDIAGKDSPSRSPRVSASPSTLFNATKKHSKAGPSEAKSDSAEPPARDDDTQFHMD